MDEISLKLETTVLNPKNDETSEFENLYKNWGKLGHQEQRRKDILEIQKSNRNSKIDMCRGIMAIVNDFEQQDFNSRKTEANYRPSIYVAGFTKTSRTYRNVLMMSEWIVEKPEDFNHNWYVVPCPKGVRTLVVATKGKTKLYNKYGLYKKTCHTALPGGNPGDNKLYNQCVILDCFHVAATNTLYVLDLLYWNNQPMTDGETEFRHFWMKTHIEEIPELKTINAKNQIMFEVLPKVDCAREPFNEFMMTLPHLNNVDLDGLLFYHKLAHYISGVTPLVGWLFPFMVNEVLGSDITVNPGYLTDKPINYVNQAQFIEEFESKWSKKRYPKSAKTVTSMDTSSENDETKNEKKECQHKNKTQRQNNDAEMACDTETNGWQPTVTSYESFPQKADTIKPSLTEIHPSIEEMQQPTQEMQLPIQEMQPSIEAKQPSIEEMQPSIEEMA